MAFDILILNGTIVDGTGKPRYRSDLGICGDRIESIGSLSTVEAERIIDASGFVISPGFIDMHSHSDRTLLYEPRAESRVHQGITTEVVGNCASTPFPVGIGGQDALDRSHVTGLRWDWTDLDGWASHLETQGISLNVAPQVGHAAIRIAVGVSDDRPPTEDEMKEMCRLAAEAVEQGAYSLTTGLTLPPSSYATTEEIVSLVKAIAPYKGTFYASHARVWAGQHVSAVEECVDIAKRAGVPAQYSHMAIIDPSAYGDGDQMVEPIEKAQSEGVDATFDMYPYTAAGTHLQQLVPEWLQEGGVDAMLLRLRDPAVRRRAIEDTSRGYFRGLPFEWDKLVVDYIGSDFNKNLVGKSIAQIAEERNIDGVRTMLALIDEENNNVGIVMHNRVEGDVKFFISHRLAMIGSDGSSVSPTGVYARDRPHPRFYGTYPRILGRYVREQPRVLSLEEAIYKMTGFPATRMSFKNRGAIHERHIADLVIFDPDTVIDRSTFEDPHQYPLGIPYVIVNGQLVIDDGKHTGARSGTVLRRGTV